MMTRYEELSQASIPLRQAVNGMPCHRCGRIVQPEDEIVFEFGTPRFYHDHCPSGATG